MNRYYREPSLKEVLSDPIVRAMMDADGVDPHELNAMLREKSAATSAQCAARVFTRAVGPLEPRNQIGGAIAVWLCGSRERAACSPHDPTPL
jgi:hypothetical protein